MPTIVGRHLYTLSVAPPPVPPRRGFEVIRPSHPVPPSPVDSMETAWSHTGLHSEEAIVPELGRGMRARRRWAEAWNVAKATMVRMIWILKPPKLPASMG